MKILKWVTIFLISIIVLVIVFILTMTLMDYRPNEKTVLFKTEATSIFDTISLLSWNIGYAGLNKEMDFFYDGGKLTRTTKEQTQKNLRVIIDFLKHNKSDIYALQEVDHKAKRSYYIDELSEISGELPLYFAFYAVNYKVFYVPLPVFNPMGYVESGLVSLSNQLPEKAIQFAYPSREKWPTGIFSLDRCFLSLYFNLSNNKKLVVINTHNSAFDNGEMRKTEMEFLRNSIISEYKKGNYIVVCGDWNQNPPLASEKIFYNQNAGNQYFKPMKITSDYMPEGWQWVSDGYPTNRFNNQPYKKGDSQETLLDFFLISPNVECISFKRFDLGYENSDHNPVQLKFKLK